MPNLFVTLLHPDDSGPVTHIAGGMNDYATLCGLAQDGDQFSAQEVKPTGKKVTCPLCHQLWKTASNIRASDFDSQAKF